MANYRKSEVPFTRWTHIENGEDNPRRFHRIIEHFGDAPGVELKRNRMPSSVITYSGNGHKGEHEAHFFYPGDRSAFPPNFHAHRKSTRRYYGYERPWPTKRDIINLACGLIALGILRFIAMEG